MKGFENILTKQVTMIIQAKSCFKMLVSVCVCIYPMSDLDDSESVFSVQQEKAEDF